MSAIVTVLLHGFTGAPESWDAIAERLEGRVVRPLLPGHGPRPQSVEAWASEIETLAAWLEREGVREAHLVGYSLGGRLASHLLDRDDLFSRATLIGAHPGLPTDEARAARRRADEAWIERLVRDGLQPFLEAWEALPMWDSQRRVDADALDRQRAVRRTHTADGLADVLRHLGLGSMPTPPASRVPVTRVVGALDAPHRALAEGTGDPVVLVEGAGHNVVLEAPRALAEFLR